MVSQEGGGKVILYDGHRGTRPSDESPRQGPHGSEPPGRGQRRSQRRVGQVEIGDPKKPNDPRYQKMHLPGGSDALRKSGLYDQPITTKTKQAEDN
ncbi:MAG TPA: hypothetical protein VN711_02035 [Candidatus Saccharimonadales bacterium]|nr:hypothetical protein [Candidatus Saccharimonadales bacterium]